MSTVPSRRLTSMRRREALGPKPPARLMSVATRSTARAGYEPGRATSSTTCTRKVRGSTRVTPKPSFGKKRATESRSITWASASVLPRRST